MTSEKKNIALKKVSYSNLDVCQRSFRRWRTRNQPLNQNQNHRVKRTERLKVRTLYYTHTDTQNICITQVGVCFCVTEITEKQTEDKLKEKGKKSIFHLIIFVSFSWAFPLSSSLTAKKKKPKLLNKLDKTIKAEIDAAEKLRKKVKMNVFLF